MRPSLRVDLGGHAQVAEDVADLAALGQRLHQELALLLAELEVVGADVGDGTRRPSPTVVLTARTGMPASLACWMTGTMPIRVARRHEDHVDALGDELLDDRDLCADSSPLPSRMSTVMP